MKKIQKRYTIACNIFTASIFILQVISLVTAQDQNANAETNQHIQTQPVSTQLTREIRALKLSAGASEDGAECPHCNVLNEVSESTNIS